MRVMQRTFPFFLKSIKTSDRRSVCMCVLIYLHMYIHMYDIWIYAYLVGFLCVVVFRLDGFVWEFYWFLLKTWIYIDIHIHMYICICDTFWVKQFITRIFINLNFKIFDTNKIRWKCMYICSQLFVFSNFYALKRLLLFFHKKIFFSFPTMNGMSAVNLKCVNNKLQKKKLHLFDL